MPRWSVSSGSPKAEARWRGVTAEVSGATISETSIPDPQSACPRSFRDGSFRDGSFRDGSFRDGAFRDHARSILPVKPDQLALNLDPVRRQDADFIGGVGGLQRDRGAAAAEALERGFLFV